jgi:hypothetical protein
VIKGCELAVQSSRHFLFSVAGVITYKEKRNDNVAKALPNLEETGPKRQREADGKSEHFPDKVQHIPTTERYA